MARATERCRDEWLCVSRVKEPSEAGLKQHRLERHYWVPVVALPTFTTRDDAVKFAQALEREADRVGIRL